ncbi:protein of unknown function (plasmid) [Rhodovastum atsumiense]|nr:protein of unknown function [Rhodovastum atsumiense]
MSKPFINMAGRRIGKLVVERRSFNPCKGDTLWRCRCDCGGIREVRGVTLRRGRVTQCLPCTGRKFRPK